MKYPQLDIRSYDPQMSGDLANLVTGRFDFMSLPHELRVMRLYSLIQMYATVRRIGDLEHTSDWDWRIEIAYAPNADGSGPALHAGTMSPHLGDDFHTPDPDADPEHSTMCDTIELRYTTEPGDYTDQFARWQNLTVEELDDDGNVQYRDVPIDSLRSINVYYD